MIHTYIYIVHTDDDRCVMSAGHRPPIVGGRQLLSQQKRTRQLLQQMTSAADPPAAAPGSSEPAPTPAVSELADGPWLPMANTFGAAWEVSGVPLDAPYGYDLRVTVSVGETIILRYGLRPCVCVTPTRLYIGPEVRVGLVTVLKVAIQPCDSIDGFARSANHAPFATSTTNTPCLPLTSQLLHTS